MDVDGAADELYGLIPDRFTARRDELSRQARDAGDTEARAALAAMRRPTVAAWAVNFLVRERESGVRDLLRIASELRAAQRALDADRLRALTGERRAAIAELGRSARELAAAAGRPLSDAALLEVQATLEAAVADENAETAVRTGRLTSSLSYSGFGEVDISEAVAASNARPRLSVVRRTDAAADVGPPRAKAAAAVRPTGQPPPSRRLADARAALADATERRDELLREAAQLRRRLEDIERELRPAETKLRSAQRRVDAAGR